MSGSALPSALMLRGCVNGAFALWLLTRHPQWVEIFRAGAVYALADGMLALLVVTMLGPRESDDTPHMLRAIGVADGIARLSAGLALLALPGLPDIPMAVVPFFGAAGVYAAGLGLMTTTLWLIARRHHLRRHSVAYEALFDPMLAVAVVATIAGAIVAVHPPTNADDLRTIASGASITLTVAFGVASAGAMGTNRRLGHL